MGELDGKVVIVSGIGPGLGRSIAIACAQAGAAVVASARTAARVEALVAELEGLGAEATGIVADITDEGDRAAIVEGTVGAYGRIDGLVNNAFVMGPMEPSVTIAPAEWRAVFEVNVVGTVALSTACAPHLAASGDGSIVMINSQAARRAAARRGPYAASKAALLVAAQVLATELGPQGVRVNSVVPGQIWGDALAGHYAAIADRRGVTVDDVVAQVTRDLALRRITRPEEIADAVVFFLSGRSAAITGQSLDVNAGNWFA
jgi:NAD(P)-dependent dehydrogenase (short-subunit alcohol dehydrogenase family)